MDYIPNNDNDRQLMLNEAGIESVNSLFKDIPRTLLMKDDLKLDRPLSELEVRNKITAMSKKNNVEATCLTGAGAYKHFIPSTVKHILSRSEFYTAYTPYQPEISQGTLQAIFEYQTVICELTSMDVANASMYDGASALAESVILAANATGKNKIVVSKALHPEYREVLKTYCDARDLLLAEVDFESKLLTSVENLKQNIDESTACVVIQNPNFFGNIEELNQFKEITHQNNALFVECIIEATSLGLLKPDADIVCGEFQSFGNPVNFGGPYLGFMAVKEKHMRQLPGRIAGVTEDINGEKGFILTLQAREQHIRRERACSNICSNENLCMLAALVSLVSLGKTGVRRMAELNVERVNYAYERLKTLDNFEIINERPFYNEIVLKCRNVEDTILELKNNNFTQGVWLGRYYPELKDCLLLCFTELVDKKEIDRLYELMEGL